MPELSNNPRFPGPSVPSTISSISSISSSPSPHHTPQIPTAGSRHRPLARQVYDSSAAQGLVSTSTSSPDQLVDLFYSRFRQVEQFIVPKAWLLQKQRDPDVYFLSSVVNYIGSSFATILHTSVPDPTATPQHLPNTAYTVQALLVLAFWFDVVRNEAQYMRHLHQARDCGLAIGMDFAGFAAANSEGSHQLEQSWSETWETVVQRCIPRSFEGDQLQLQLQLPIEEPNITRGMTVSSSMTIEPQSWVWAETFTEQSAYNPYQLMDASQPGAQDYTQSFPTRYRTSHTVPSQGLDFRDLPLTTTWDDVQVPVTRGPNIPPRQP